MLYRARFVENAYSFDGSKGYWIYDWTDNPTDGTLIRSDPPGIDGYTLITAEVS